MLSPKIFQQIKLITEKLRIMEQIKELTTRNTEIFDLACIEIKDKYDPKPLFKDWYQEARKYCNGANFMSLATTTSNGHVSNRTVVLREWTEDNEFLMTTNKNSNKAEENPCVALCFYWTYIKDNNRINRQVTINGKASKLNDSYIREYYEKSPIHIKIRNHLFENEGERVDWQEVKCKHDQLVRRVIENGEQLEMPKNLVAYKIIPNKMVFYYDYDSHLPDRVEFCKVTSENRWESHHIVP